MMNKINELNKRFGIAGVLEFEPYHGVFVAARIRNAAGEALVSLHGGQVMAFQPTGEEPVLWVSRECRYAPRTALRGGIPVCWPWFGSHPVDKSQPSHGFARLENWLVMSAEAVDAAHTRLKLSLGDIPDWRGPWPQASTLSLTVTVGAALELVLTMQNASDQPMRCTTALHTYFNVADVSAIQVTGLDGCRYLDTVTTPWQERIQEGPVTFGHEVDRAYLDTEATCEIHDPGLARRLVIEKSGSRSTVVWNPWIAKSQRMPDFGDDEYPGMVCVETVNTASDARVIAPGDAHTLAATIHVERL